MERQINPPDCIMAIVRLYGNTDEELNDNDPRAVAEKVACWDFDEQGFFASRYYGPIKPLLLLINGVRIWAIPEGTGAMVRFNYLPDFVAFQREKLCG